MKEKEKLLAGRGIVITGANQGLGLAIAEDCVVEGADLVICARNGELLKEVAEELQKRCVGAQKVRSIVADVSVEADVKALFDCARNELPNFTGIVNNAGVYGPKGATEEVNLDEWRKAIEINLLGTVIPCRFALSEFKKGSSPTNPKKIVNLSGGGATAPLPNISAYAASKAAVVRFTETIAEENRTHGIDINAIAPGALNTRLLDEVIAAGPDKVGAKFHERALAQKKDGGAPLETGAKLCTFLLSKQSDGITGKLISAIWDPWERFGVHREELNRTDIYTLRRIVPRERGFSWGER